MSATSDSLEVNKAYAQCLLPKYNNELVKEMAYPVYLGKDKEPLCVDTISIQLREEGLSWVKSPYCTTDPSEQKQCDYWCLQPIEEKWINIPIVTDTTCNKEYQIRSYKTLKPLANNKMSVWMTAEETKELQQMSNSSTLDDLPSDAVIGDCYRRCLVPAQFEVIEDSIEYPVPMNTGAYDFDKKCQQITTTYLIQDAYITISRGNFMCGHSFEVNPSECNPWIKKEIPAQYKTISYMDTTCHSYQLKRFPYTKQTTSAYLSTWEKVSCD